MIKKNKAAKLYLLRGSKTTFSTSREHGSSLFIQGADGKTKVSVPVSIDDEIAYAKRRLASGKGGSWVDFPLPDMHSYLTISEEDKLESITSIRKWALRWVEKARSLDCTKWEIVDLEWNDKNLVGALVENFLISSYSFDSFKTEKTPIIELVSINSKCFSSLDLETAKKTAQEVNWVKEMVNKPFSALNAAGFAKEMSTHAALLGIQTKVWTKKEIEKADMGGLLGVNKGSVDEPSFTELVYKPQSAKNAKPIVLVGKGVVFDAGGMNIKTGSYMEDMKTDMAGGAMAAGIISLLAKFAVPLYVVALIPATDNRLNGNALVPGDIIRIGKTTTVEIVNTDAEGRLLLADAVNYAQQTYNPSCIISMATLTGAASRALGTKGIVAMQENLTDSMLQNMSIASEETQEKYWFFPMWKEYEKELESQVADLKNCGSASAGMITAAKFVSHFAKSPFLHLDVAGVAYLDKAESYWTKGATAMGMRLIYAFLQHEAKQRK